MKNFRKRLKERKKGVTSIEAVIGTLIFLFAFCATCDLITLSNRYSSLTDTGKELARTISVQGGALATAPGGYASNYYTITQIQSMVEKQMDAAGFDPGDYVVTIDYEGIYEDATEESKEYKETQKIIYFDDTGALQATPTLKIDYLSNFTLKITAKYKWRFMSTFIPDRTTYLTVSMPGTSEWKYNYDAWESEK